MRRITALSIVLATIGLVGFPGGAGAATGVGGALAGDQVYGQWLYGELFVRHARDGEPSRPKTYLLVDRIRHLEPRSAPQAAEMFDTPTDSSV
jgi:hypothetical protein